MKTCNGEGRGGRVNGEIFGGKKKKKIYAIELCEIRQKKLWREECVMSLQVFVPLLFFRGNLHFSHRRKTKKNSK